MDERSAVACHYTHLLTNGIRFLLESHTLSLSLVFSLSDPNPRGQAPTLVFVLIDCFPGWPGAQCEGGKHY